MLDWKNRRAELLQDLETHIEIETQENIDSGMAPAQARQAALKKFGNVLLTAEESRDIWGWLWLEHLLLDVRYALRSLSQDPGYAATLVLILVLGLGSVTCMLAIVHSILLLPVALPQSDRLVQIYSEDRPGGASTSSQALSYPVIDDLRRSNHAFAGIGGYNIMVRPVGLPDGSRASVLVEVTADFFQMLGVSAKVGRLIDASQAHAPVAVVSYDFWRERLNSDPAAVGLSIKVAGRPRTIIGVLPRGFHVPQGAGESIVYIPISANSAGEDDFGIESAAVLARRKSGLSIQQALTDAQSIFSHSTRKNAEQHRRLGMRSYQDLVVGDIRKSLWALLGAAAVLLLIACANAANLQIGRTAGRMSELSVRAALGAGFRRLFQQLITENVVVSLISAVLGGVFAYCAVVAIRHAYGTEFPRFDELSIDIPVLLVSSLLAVLVGILASIAPALSIRRQTNQRYSTRTATQRSRLPSFLVASQIALTCVLLVTSGLFIRTLQSLESVQLGFDPQGVTTLVLMPENQEQDPELSRQIETRLLRRFESIPGVQSVTMQTEIPFSSYNMALNGSTEVPGRPFSDGDNAFYSLVSTDFVRTSGIRLTAGRSFLPADESAAAISVLVNQAFQKKFLATRQPIGETVNFHRKPGETDSDIPFARPMTIVGVVENEIQGGDLGAPYEPMVYIDYLQLPKASLLSAVFNMAAQYAVRSTLSPATVASELRAVVKKEAPAMVEMNLRVMEQGVSKSLNQRRLALRVVTAFGFVALLLSAVGIYGVLAYSVTLRRREIGIRIALGSSRSKAAGLIATHAGKMVMLGLLLGDFGAWAAGRAVHSFLYGVDPLDVETLLATGTLLLLVCSAASLLPAVRAARVDPAETLRSE
jgi:predicted permease